MLVAVLCLLFWIRSVLWVLLRISLCRTLLLMLRSLSLTSILPSSALSSLSVLLQKGNAEILAQGCLMARSALQVG